MLTLEGIKFSYDDFRLAADLSIAAGERIAVLGPSGAGKSTLLSLIGGFTQPSGGRILWQGNDITNAPPSRRPVATIFQDNNLFPHLSVELNVGLGLRPNGRLRAEDRARVSRALADVGLDGFNARKPGDLSGGQQSRVALARAQLQDKPILLLDEAFAALGPALKSDMIALVLDLAGRRNRTVVMVTHEPEDAHRLHGKTIVVADGRALPPRDTAALFADPPRSLEAYLA